MTILLAHVTAERALVAVDTLGYWHGQSGPQPQTEWPKMMLLPMLDTIVAVSGETDVLGAIYNLLLPPPGSDFDSLVQEVRRGLIDRAVEMVWRAREERELPVWPEQVVLIAGYSRQHQKCSALLSHHKRGGQPSQLHELGHLVAPPIQHPRIPDTRNAMLEIAREQVATSKHVGGRLLVAEISAAGVSCSTGIPL